MSIGACAGNGIISVHWDANKRVVDAAHRSRSSLRAAGNYYSKTAYPGEHFVECMRRSYVTVREYVDTTGMFLSGHFILSYFSREVPRIPLRVPSLFIYSSPCLLEIHLKVISPSVVFTLKA